MATAYDSANIIIPQGGGYKAGSLYGWNPQDSSLVDFSVTRAGATATRVNSSGLIESVAANVPRIDWAEGGSCPSLLVEPQRTNLNTYSEDLTNPTYSTFGTETSVTANADTAPDGNNTADQVNILSGTGRFGTAITLAGDTTYTISFYCKNIDVSAVDLLLSNTDGGADGSYFSEINTSDYTRIERTFTTDPGTPLVSIQLTRSATIGGSLYIWGVQVEEGSYATSYIPTVASTETRNADVITKTSIASLLGQSEGTIYFEGLVFQDTFNGVSINDGSANNRFRIGTAGSGQFTIVSSTGGVVQTNAVSASSQYSINTYFKVAARYATNDVALYKGGSSLITDNTWSAMSGIDRLQFQDPSGGAFYGRIRSLAVYDIALTNTELANLTT